MTEHPEAPGPPPDAGGADRPPRHELRLEEWALRQDFPIPPKVKKAILQRLINDATDDGDDDGDDDDDGDTERRPGRARLIKTRDQNAAARVIASFCGLTLRQQALDLARRKLERAEAGGADLAAVHDRMDAAIADYTDPDEPEAPTDGPSPGP